MNLAPQLDKASGAVILPIDQFQPTWEENDILATAGAVSIAICARDHGVRFVAPPPISDPVYISENYFGPWTVDQAERFAFVQPMSQADLFANGIIQVAPSDPSVQGENPNLSLTEDDWKVVDECGASASANGFGAATQLVGPWTEQLKAAKDAFADGPQSKELLQELGTCFASHGMEPDPKVPWTVRGADGMKLSEEQVQLALKVVGCKDAMHFTEQMADLEARATIPIIAEFQNELVEQRRTIDAALERARTLIAENSDLIRHDS